MRKNIYILFSILCFSFCQTFAQTSLRQARISNTHVKKSNNSQQNKVVKIERPTKLSTSKKNSNKTYSNDTIYCTQTKKQHGWFAPMDTITKEIACHRNHYYRFTRKNSAGNWERMECLDGYGKYRTGTMMPYILKLGTASESDQTAKKDWIDKLNKTCIYDFISDYTGKTIIQERAYNEERNIVYSYSRVPIGNNQFNGSYRDMNGLPAEMREEVNYVYGTLVRITEDQWGNDSIIQYIDAKGVAKLNSDSVAREVYICDKYGHVLKQQSQNSDGSLAIDNWGNCGIEYEWTDKHLIKSATYMDDNWRPMRMPAKRGVTGRENVIKTNYEYDEYFRQTSEYYTDEKGNPDINTLGTHKILSEFDKHGNLVAQYGYDLQEHLSPINESQVAVEKYSFDPKGNLTDVVFLDKNSKPCSTAGYLSRVHLEYDKDGNQILDERYSAESGTETLCSKEEIRKDYKYTLWNDGTSRIDSLDLKGRTTFVGFYGKDGNYEMTEGRAYERYTYIDEIGKSISEEIDYDEQGKKVDVNGICRTVILTDSTTWTQTKWRYDSKDVLKESFIHRYSPNFEELIGQNDANSIGIMSRSGGSSSVRLYNGNVLRNANGDFVSIYGTDEFGEPDYITSNSMTYYYQKQFPHSSTKFYNENNNVIENESNFKDTLPKIMSIEVTDSSAYKLGIRDNDLIICFGNYSVNLEEVRSCTDFRREWSIRSVLDATDNKRMIVFRITDAAKNEYGIYEIKGLNGTCSELGFIPHMRFLTEKQKNRITDAISSEISKDNSLISSSDIKKKNYNEGDNMILLSYTDLYREVRNEPYGSTVKDPAILLGTCIKDRGLRWSIEDKNSTSSFEEMLNTRWYKATNYPTWQFYFTSNGKDVIPLSIDCQNVSPVIYGADAYTKWFDAFISDEDFAKITSLYNIVNNNIKRLLKENHSIPSKSLQGIWSSHKEAEDDFGPEMYIDIKKDGTFKGTYVNYGTIKYNDALAIFKKEKIIDGQWTTGGNWLFYTPESNNSIRISCVDAIGLDEESKSRAIAYVNIDCRNNPQNYTSRLTLLSDDTHGDLYVYKYSKNELEFIDTNGDTIKVYKEKKLPNILLRKYDESVSNSNNSQINETSPLIGNWQCQIPDVENSYVEFDLAQNGVISIEASVILPQEVNDTCVANILMDLNIEGTWKPTSNGFKMDINPERLSINLDYNLIGVDKETEEQLIPALKDYIEPQKTELGLALLEGFGNEMEVTEVDSVRMVMNGNILNRIPSSKTTVVGRVEGDEGYMVEKGYTGLYVILEWCDWNCKQTVDDFAAEFEKQRENEKHIVLLPVESVEGKDVFKDIIEFNSITTKLGLRIMDQSVGYNYYKKNVLSRYKNFKMNKLN